MAIKKHVKLNIQGDKASLSDKIIVYRNDRGVDICIELENFTYIIENKTTPSMIISARVLKPNKIDYFDINTLRIDGNKIIFTITHEMTNELSEIGTYYVQIHLYDDIGNRISIPPISFTVKPLVANGGDIDFARTDYSKTDESFVAPNTLDSFIIDGNYIKTNWKPGDWITSAKMNNIESGIEKNILKEPFKVTGVNIGGIKDGDIFENGVTGLDIIKKLLTKKIPPVYNPPVLSFTSSVMSAEEGSIITPELKLNFVQNDAGVVKRYSIKKENEEVSSQAQVTLPSFNIFNDINFSGTVEYEEGAIKNDNLGTPDYENSIKAGSLTSSITIKAYRPYWGFCDNSNNIPTAEEIRAKIYYGLNPQVDTSIKVTTNLNTKRIIFAYPITLRDCLKIRYEDLNDDNNKTAFNYITLNIPDASGTNEIAYRIYYYISPVPFGVNAKFTLTI